MATAVSLAPLRQVLTGFGYNFSEPREISIGSADGLDDIMELTTIPAGIDYFPIPNKVLMNWDISIEGVPIYFNGIDSLEDVYVAKFI